MSDSFQSQIFVVSPLFFHFQAFINFQDEWINDQSQQGSTRPRQSLHTRRDFGQRKIVEAFFHPGCQFMISVKQSRLVKSSRKAGRKYLLFVVVAHRSKEIPEISQSEAEEEIVLLGQV